MELDFDPYGYSYKVCPSCSKEKPLTDAYYRRTGTGKGQGTYSIKCRQCTRPHRFSKPDIITRKPSTKGFEFFCTPRGWRR